MLIKFIISEDSSSTSDKSYAGSTSRNSASNFTVSTHSAFQPNVPRSVAQRASSQNQEISAGTSRLNDEEMDRSDLSDNLNNVEANRILASVLSRVSRIAQQQNQNRASR